jgi:succinate dehydrogenase/fumarate reductase-like Fe-S protein
VNRCKRYHIEAPSIKDLVSDLTNVYTLLNNIDVAIDPNLNDHSDMPNSQQDQLM